LEPISDEALIEKLSNEVEGKILNYERISSRYKKRPYEIKRELDGMYLEKVKQIINQVGDFIGGYLTRFLSYQRSIFDYVRKHKVEFLSEYKVLEEVRVITDKEEKELSLGFDLPSFIYLPRILLRSKGQDVYLYNHLGSKISFVIGDAENPKTDDYFVEDAMEELWHLAIYPHLIEKLNTNLKNRQFIPSEFDLSKMLVKEGELLSKAFVLACLEEFVRKRGYITPNKEVDSQRRILAEEIRRKGIKKALKEIGRSVIGCRIIRGQMSQDVREQPHV
jgi:hypothetical protein